jgi:hypothetical protein
VVSFRQSTERLLEAAAREGLGSCAFTLSRVGVR